ncbi:MAG: calcium/sodium antiporter [Candidatus Colwellbacteria bacterium]|jgi:cation:H+ antiporter|nr:calcium/sodium antiporter [Candidatus Colwellbacteria bacterium]MCK9497249.1 calcium/sodium antiporter [Candidatus Colwellbacteria bacterium]MDD3752390.1 calcium/sodium antiporter [Candidatus Colwellbacteria bacterium]MDD4818645.1 calcium/sodium antiporter [Candidatus Colwellbacteria bacterium]
MVVSLILFFIGFFILIKGADILIDGASFIAQKLHLSNWLVGTVIAGIGTSIPEFSITLVSNFAGQTQVAVGNLVGSAIVNILLVLGVSAIAAPLVIRDSWIKRDMAWNIFSIAVFLLFAYLPIGGPIGQLSRIEGIILVGLFIVWLWRVIREKTNGDDEATEYSFTFITAIVMIIAGFIGVVIGGNWVVNGAAILAGAFGISKGLIALTIIGIGTSLPELAVSVMAALKKQPGIAMGNIIGSTIFNFLIIAGVSAITFPFFFPTGLFTDTLIAGFAGMLLLLLMFFGRKKILTKAKGIILVGAYVFYLFYLIIGR